MGEMVLVDVDRYTGQPIYANSDVWQGTGLPVQGIGDGSDAFLAAYAKAQETAAAQREWAMSLDPNRVQINYDNGTWEYLPEPYNPNSLPELTQEDFLKLSLADQPYTGATDTFTAPAPISPSTPSYSIIDAPNDPTGQPKGTLDTIWGNQAVAISNFKFLGLTGIAAVIAIMALFSNKRSYN